MECSGGSGEFAPLTLANHDLLEYWFVEVDFPRKLPELAAASP